MYLNKKCSSAIFKNTSEKVTNATRRVRGTFPGDEHISHASAVTLEGRPPGTECVLAVTA